ncbi:MAG: hypothetical protein KDC30_10990 [Saprospiraceae bacterium]|nr:hypothetical protein [Saprospiraceae bacterium]
MNSIRHIFVLIAALSLPLFSTAQGNLPSENVTVLKNFEAKLAEAERVEIQPELPATDTVRLTQVYTLPFKTLSVDYPPPRIRPIAMPRDEVQEGYNGYLKLGVGIPTTFYADASYHLFNDELYDLGLRFLHHSTNNKKVDNQRFMFNQVGVDGNYYFDQGFAVNGRLQYTSDIVHFYGYNFDPDLEGRPIATEDIRQNFSTLDLGVGIFNSARTVADFNYSADADLYFMSDSYGATERGFNLRAKGTKWVNELHSIDIGLRTDFTTYEDTAKQNLNNFYLTPSFTFHGEFLKAKLGGIVASHEDEFFLYPDAQVTANIIGSSLAAFIGAEGNLQKNTFRSLSDYNPFIVSRVELRNTDYLHFYGGVQGNLKVLEYSGQVGYQQADDLAMYLVEDPPENDVRKRFVVLYDSVSIFNIRGSLTARPLKGLEIIGTVNQNFYDPANQEKAWHLPSLTINGSILYKTLEDQLLLKTEIFVENGVPYLNSDGIADNLNGLFDLSLGAEYFFSDNFGAFVQINNLLDNKRRRWDFYPTYGMNVLVGASARF